MSQILISLSVWLHAIATVIFIGYYLLLAWIFLPVLSKDGNGIALSEISRRSRVWLYTSLLIFIITGTYLMVIDPGYLGFMNFGNPWGIIMMIKHILVFVMLAIGFWFNAILRVGPLMSSNSGAIQAIARFRWYAKAMAICGVLVLLLTSISQAQ